MSGIFTIWGHFEISKDGMSNILSHTQNKYFSAAIEKKYILSRKLSIWLFLRPILNYPLSFVGFDSFSDVYPDEFQKLWSEVLLYALAFGQS